MTSITSSSISHCTTFNVIANSSPRKGINSLPMAIRSNLSYDSSPLFDAAKHTVDSYVESGMVIGLGSGRASGFAIQFLGQKLLSGALKDIVGVPTSISSATEAAKAGVPLDQYRDSSKKKKHLLRSLGVKRCRAVSQYSNKRYTGTSALQMILKAARKLVLIVMGKQYRGGVDGSIPVLIKSINWMDIAEEIDDLFLGDAEVWRRSSMGLVNPLGGDFPLITKEGYNVLDVIFTSPIVNLADVADSLDQIDGVVEHGVIARIPCTAVIASEDGLRTVDNTLGLEGSKV